MLCKGNPFCRECVCMHVSQRLNAAMAFIDGDRNGEKNVVWIRCFAFTMCSFIERLFSNLWIIPQENQCCGWSMVTSKSAMCCLEGVIISCLAVCTCLKFQAKQNGTIYVAFTDIA